MDPTTLEIHTRRLKAYKDENGSSADGGEVQTDLFGNDDSAMIEMVKISKAAGELVKENKQKILAVKGVVKRPQVAREMGVDINDPEAVKAAIAQLEYENQRLMSPTPEPEILHKIKVRAGLETEESQVVETDEAAMQDDSLDLGLAASGGMSPRSLKIREKLKGIFDKIFSEKIPNVMFDFAKVSKRTIDKVLEITSGKVDLSEYKHVISSNSIYHARKGGHFEGNNFSDSLPLTKEDLLRVGDVVENWDDITFRKRKNADTITYQKAYPDGTILYVEEILNGDGNRRPKRLASKTIYKRKSGRFTNTAEASRYTSKTMSQSHSSNPQSDNSAQSQGENSGNVKGGIELGFSGSVGVNIHNEFNDTISSVINEIVKIKSQNISTDTASLEKLYCKRDSAGEKILDLKVAKLSEKQKQYFGIKDPYVYTSLFDILDHHFNHHSELNESAYLNLPEVIFEANIVAHGTKPNSFVFGKNLDKWHIATNVINKEKGKAVLYKNLFVTSKGEKFFKNKNIIRELSSWEDRPTSIQPTNNGNGGDGNISTRQGDNPHNPQSDNSAQSQGKKSGNVKGGIEAKQVDASADISEPIDVAEADYRKISEIAQKEFKAKPALLSRVISKSRSILPRTVKFDKSKNRLAGVPSIADIRRYAERAFAVPIAAKMRRDNPKFLGVYLSDLQAIRTRGGHTNDIGLLAHELGHHLETILFAGKLSEAETAAARELAAYCVERFGDNVYPQNEHVSEGFAQFVSDLLTDVNDARARCPQAYALLERALRDNSNAAAVFDNIRQMVALNKNGSAFDRVQANIRRKSDMEKTPFMEKIKGLRRLYRRKLIDSNEGIAELAQEVDRQSPGNGKKFLDMVTNYQGGHIGQSDYSIKNQQLDIDGNVVGKGLEQIMSDNLGAAFDRESFSAYLYARRAGKSDKNFFSKMLDNFFYRIKHRRIIKKQMNNWWFSRKVA